VLGSGDTPVTLRAPAQWSMTAVAWDPDGSRLAAGGADQIIHMYDVTRARELVNLHGHVGRVTSLRYTSDGGSLISTSSDGTVKVWDGGRRTRPD